MKKIFLSFLLILSSQLFSNAQTPFVSQIINSVSIDSLMLTVRQLSGDTTVLINNQVDSITSRFASFYDSAEIKKAALFIEQKFKSFGLKPVEQQFNNYIGYTGKNILAYQQGTDKSTHCYIICAHYDNLPSGARNYGADDNGSGVSAVIEAARLLCKQPLHYSIYYMLFDHEEQGLIGSNYFANFRFADTPILGVINMDMIAYDGNNDSVANIHIRPAGGDSRISDKIIYTDSVYTLGINLKVYSELGKLNSDHASFWINLMPAVLFIEDDMTGDFNPKYHTVDDRINLFNTSYYQRMAKLAIGTLAGFAADSSHAGINEISSQQNEIILYPNPVNNSFTISTILSKNVLIRITNIVGEIVFEKEIQIENNSLNIQLPENFSQGLYHVSLMDENGFLYKRFLKL